MSKQVPLEQTEIDVGSVRCACGCGEEADQLYKGIPIPSINPMSHYRAYQRREQGVKDIRRYSLQL